MKNNIQYPPSRLLAFRVNKAVKIFAVIIFVVAVFFFVDPVKAQNVGQYTSPHIACQHFYKQQGISVVRDLEHDCLIKAGNNKTGFVYTHLYDSGSNFCMEVTSSIGRIAGPQCVPISSTGRAKQQPQKTQNQTGGLNSSSSKKAEVSKPIIIKKGEPYKHDFSKELINLLDPQDQSGPYTFSYNTMGGFPPMGLSMGLDGVLKGTPVGKDGKFEACVTNGSRRKVCKVLDIKLDRDKSDKPELETMEPIESRNINYQDLVYGEQGQIKSGIHERVAIAMKDGSIVEMDKNSTLTPDSEYELTTDLGKFRFKYNELPGSFCAYGSVLSESCRQVNTPNGTIKIKGTEFAVETDSSGTIISVIEGTLLVSDAKGKKEIEINKGQFAFLKKGSPLEAPQSFEPSQLDRWWEKEDTNWDAQDIFMIIMIISVGLFIFILLILVIVKIAKKFGKKKTDIAIAPGAEESNQKTLEVKKNNDGSKKSRACLSVLIFIIIIIFFIILTIFL
jgi:hypothetical protein